jgi:hypothetical protein
MPTAHEKHLKRKEELALMTLGDGANKFLVKIGKTDTDVCVAIGSLSHVRGQVNNLNNQALGWAVTFGTDITTWDEWHD